MKLQTLRSFDGGYSSDVSVLCPQREESLSQTLGHKQMIARGMGLSYASASFGASTTSIDMRTYSRVLDFDDTTGDVWVEVGATLREVTNFLLKKQRCLAVMPGHSEISVGGCIAADVHGKNQARDGTFRHHVKEIQLFHPEHGMVSLSRTKHPEIFELTCGGYGLTGVILNARIKTVPLPNAAMKITATAIDTPTNAVALMKELATKSAVVYSWHDFLAGSDRGFVISGEVCQDTAPSSAPLKRYELTANGRARLPFSLHGKLLGRFINALLTKSYSSKKQRQVGLGKAVFPVTGSELYFYLFGARGFHEYQAIVPFESFSDYIRDTKAASKKYNVPIVLASGKIFQGEPSLLRFDGTGVCFAINVPRSKKSKAFLDRMDEIAVAYKCRPNIIKDSRLPLQVVEQCFSEYSYFKSLLADWDNRRTFKSELSERLGL